MTFHGPDLHSPTQHLLSHLFLNLRSQMSLRIKIWMDINKRRMDFIRANDEKKDLTLESVLTTRQPPYLLTPRRYGPCRARPPKQSACKHLFLCRSPPSHDSHSPQISLHLVQPSILWASRPLRPPGISVNSFLTALS